MSELGDPAGRSTAVVAVVLLIVLLAQLQLVGVVRTPSLRGRRRALVVAIAPLLAAFVLVAGLRLVGIAHTRP